MQAKDLLFRQANHLSPGVLSNLRALDGAAAQRDAQRHDSQDQVRRTGLSSTTAGSVGFFGAKGLAELSGITGLGGFSTNRLKQISRSLSSFKKRQSFTTPAGPDFGLVRGDTIAS
jgi:hypothetical protein